MLSSCLLRMWLESNSHQHHSLWPIISNDGTCTVTKSGGVQVPLFLVNRDTWKFLFFEKLSHEMSGFSHLEHLVIAPSAMKQLLRIYFLQPNSHVNKNYILEKIYMEIFIW